MKWATILLFALIGSARAQSPAPATENSPAESVISLDRFDQCGFISRFSPNKIDSQCFQNIDNAVLDQDYSILRRNGYASYLATPCASLQSVRGLWPFYGTDGSQYLLIFSSVTMYSSKGDGTCTAITGLTSLSPTAQMSCVQGMGQEWCTDGVDAVFETNVVTTATVSGAPLGKYIGFFRNRLIIAGVSGFLTQIYLSGELNGTDWTLPTVTYSTSPAVLNISGTNDGQAVSCLMGEFQNGYYIGRAYDTYLLSGYDLRDFGISKVDQQIGCMDNNSPQMVNNTLMWLSHRGVESLSGTQINWVSYPIDPTIKTIISAAGNSQAFTVNSNNFTTGNLTASGPGAPISSTIFPGNLTVSSNTINQNTNAQLLLWTGVAGSTWGVSGNTLHTSQDQANKCTGAKIDSPGFDNTFSTPTFYCQYYIRQSGSFPIQTNPSSMSVEFSSVGVNGPWSGPVVCASTGTNTSITTAVSGNASYSGNGRYVRIEAYDNTCSSNSGVNFSSFTLITETTAYYITPCVTVSTPSSWSTLSVDAVTNGGSFSFWTSTGATCAIATATNANWTSQIPNSFISVTTNTSNIAARVLFSLDVATETPTLNDISFNWNQGASRPPVSTTQYLNRYYLFYTTSSAVGAYNDHAVVFDQNAHWQLLDDINAASSALYLNQLFLGDSQATGKIYLFDSGQDDAGGSFTFSFQTPDLDGGDPISPKTFKRAYLILGAPSPTTLSGSMSCNYAISGSATTYSLGTVNLSEAPEQGGYFVAKIPFPTTSPTTGQWVNLSCSNVGTQGPLRVYGVRIVYVKNDWP